MVRVTNLSSPIELRWPNLRLAGAVKNEKASRNFITRPTRVILPLSPNHGFFGSDGPYSESKIFLETLFNRWDAAS